MQKVVGSNPISRFERNPRKAGGFLVVGSGAFRAEVLRVNAWVSTLQAWRIGWPVGQAAHRLVGRSRRRGDN